MFRNAFDSDNVWSPEGRLFQLEYASECEKAGASVVTLKSQDCVVLITHNRFESSMTTQRKLIPLDDHIGLAINGIAADCMKIKRFLRQQCLNYKFTYGGNFPINELVDNLGLKMQESTQICEKRPYGVGLILAGFDANGPNIYHIDSSGNNMRCKAFSMGFRSQSSQKYLEKQLENIPAYDKQLLIVHGLTAMRDSLLRDYPITRLSVNIGYATKTEPFTILDQFQTETEIFNFLSIMGPLAGVNQTPTARRHSDDIEERPAVADVPEARQPSDDDADPYDTDTDDEIAVSSGIPEDKKPGSARQGSDDEEAGPSGLRGDDKKADSSEIDSDD